MQNVVVRKWLVIGGKRVCVDNISGYEGAGDSTTVVYLDGGHRVYLVCTPQQLQDTIEGLNNQ